MSESHEERLKRLAAQGGWIGVDLDGTLAEYGGWQGHGLIGKPILPMLERVRTWIASGIEVRIFTARAGEPEAIGPIMEWCVKHIGVALAVTATKDYGMIELWDDRAVQVIPNRGLRVDGLP